MDYSAALPTFIITLREGVEAALVVGIVLACLQKSDQAHLSRWVWGGVAGGLAASAAVGALFSWVIGGVGALDPKYAPAIEPLLEGIFGVFAIAMLSWMLIWMTRQARVLKGQLEGTVRLAFDRADRAEWAIFWLILFAVLREGFETVLFVASRFTNGPASALGAVLGISAAVTIAALIFGYGVRIDLRRFFQTLGILLLFIVAGLVVTALGHLDAAVQVFSRADRASEALCFFREAYVRNPSCILGPGIWDASQVLPDDRLPGIVLSALLGYTARLYLVQALGYGLFLVTVGGLYWQSLAGRSLWPLKPERISRSAR